MPYWYHFFSSDIETLSLQLYFWHTCLYNYISEACHVVNDSYMWMTPTHVNDSYSCEWCRETLTCYITRCFYTKSAEILCHLGNTTQAETQRHRPAPVPRNVGQLSRRAAGTAPSAVYSDHKIRSRGWDSQVRPSQIAGVRQSNQTQQDSWGQIVSG